MFMHFDMNYNHSRILFLLFNIYYGYVWNPEIARERKKIVRKIIFSCLVSL